MKTGIHRPEWYTSVIPMVQVDGSDGIGTCRLISTLNNNPLDLIENIRVQLSVFA